MAAGSVQVAELNNGASIPLLGMGTGSLDTVSYAEKKAAMRGAIEVGYRHFDTAAAYNSEGFLGEALAEAMASGLVKRQDLFITSKLQPADSYPEAVLPAITKSLKELKLDYLDLYLIHWPVRMKETLWETKPDNALPLDVRGTWQAMETALQRGLTRAIGVSNFSSKKILDLLEFADIPPAVNQVEMHPKWQQRQLRATCSKFNIHVSAYSPLGAPPMPWGTPDVIEDPVITDIALKHGRSPAQVVLRWGLDQGVSVLPKSFTKKRIIENFQVFGWQLSEEDHQRIGKLEQKKNVDGHFLCSEDGPFKDVQELWDGEISDPIHNEYNRNHIAIA